MDDIARSLKEAQNTAAALFDATVSSGLIKAGKLESELTKDIHETGAARIWIAAPLAQTHRPRRL